MKALGLAILISSLAAGCATTAEVDFNDQLAKTVASRKKVFRGCYTKHGEKKEVTTVVKYSIGYTGDIKFADIDAASSPHSTAALGECILREFKTLKLPEVQGHDGAYGSYAFRFSTE